MAVEGDNVNLRLDLQAPSNVATDFAYDAAALDPVLIELLAACRILTESPDIKSLEAMLATELKQPKS